jgi:GntR family transcriptional repressor for pyruvate dehydrogenase complex
MNRNTLVGEIVEQLINYLASNRIGPGDKLPSERALSERLGIGRSSVREAVKALHLLGIVDVRLGDGTYLRARESAVLPQILEWGLILSQPSTADLVEARQFIEVFIARRAAERFTQGDADSIAAADSLTACLERMTKARLSGNPQEHVEADVEFHMGIAELAGNAVVVEMLRSIRGLLHVWFTRMAAASLSGDSEKTHAQVVEAIRASDPDAAEAAMRTLITSAGELLLDIQAQNAETDRPE